MANKLKSLQCFVTQYDDRLFRNYCLNNNTTAYKLLKSFVEKIAEKQDQIERLENGLPFNIPIPTLVYKKQHFNVDVDTTTRQVYFDEHLDNCK